MDQNFTFTPENKKKALELLTHYPEDRKKAALLPLLDMAQRQNKGWLSGEVISYIAGFLNLPEIRVYEVATFYSMFNLKPVGQYVVHICTTTPCWLRKSDEIVKACKDILKIDMGQTTSDGMFTLKEVECLGACVNAPIVQINDDYYEDVNYETMQHILTDLMAGKKPKIGSQIDRCHSAPENFSRDSSC